MRVIWVVGADPLAVDQLRSHFRLERLGAEYTLRTAAELTGVPKIDLENPGVVILLDAFLPAHPGFEGVKFLRNAGFQGFIFIFGEPAAEMSVEAFRNLKLSGFFPNFEKCDLALAAGVIHNQLYFDGEVDFSHFLMGGGRSSSEQISDFKEFAAFGVKLASFVSRFGLDISLLKKILMGLSLAHVKTTSGSPQVDQPFTIHFGLDKRKLLLGVSTLSRGITREALVSDFCEVLQTLKTPRPLPGTLFPELFHVGRAAENLLILTGSALDPEEHLDPMMIIVGLNFPQGTNKIITRESFFGLLQIHRTPEYEEVQGAEGLENLQKESQIEIEQSKGPINLAQMAIDKSNSQEAAEAQVEVDQESLNPEKPKEISTETPDGMLDSQDINSILSEEVRVMGDSPGFVDSLAPQTKSPMSEEPEGFSESENSPEAPVVGIADYGQDAQAVIELQKKLDESNLEMIRLKDLVSAMGQDVKRLMKERRQPTTDKELRDAVTQFQEKVKKLQAEKVKSEEDLADKNRLIETLKVQVETLSRAKPAA